MFTPTIQHFDSIDSTNLEAMRQAKAGAREGLCIIAREQTQGRGRLDRSWQSPKDAGLYFSIVLRPSFEIGRWPLISLAAALACSDALAKACQLTVDIKWPNDICVADRKLGGILAEAIDTSAGAAVALGMGINLTSQSLPPELNDVATSIESVSGLSVDRELLIAELITATTRRYEVLASEAGAERTIREWCAKSSYAYDRDVRVTLHDESFEGITHGLESDGALRVVTADGVLKIVRAGDVSALRATSIRDSNQ
jgi:BirA family transcriptional regulator, biotin operon repressor / biotin---[acetyl-CoA-carboxylase] ligase